MLNYLRQLFHWSDYIRIPQDGTGVSNNLKGYIESCVRERVGQQLKIAVIGAPGTGKTTLCSALVNNVFGQLDLYQDRVNEPREYSNPEVPSITYYDYPGIDLHDAKHDEYYNKFTSFDAFIIVTALRVQEIDLALLGSIVKKLGKTVLFVRCKIDQDIESFKENFGSQIDDDTLVHKIKKTVEDSIQQLQYPDIPVFIVSSRQPDKWDFGKLQETLIRGRMQLNKQSIAEDIKKDVKGLIVSKRAWMEKLLETASWVLGFACFLFVPNFFYVFMIHAVRKGVDYWRSSYLFDELVGGIRSRRSSHNLLYSEQSPENIVEDTVRESIQDAKYEWIHLVPLVGTIPCAINAYQSTKRIGTKLLLQFEKDSMEKWCQEVDREVERA